MSDLAPLKGLPALQSLDCSSTQVSDLAPLKGLTALQSLNCSDTQVSDLAPLKGLTALQSLDCSDTQVSDLSPLIGLAKLEELTCNGLKLAALPEWFVTAPAIRELYFHQTRIPGVPVEVLSASDDENCLAKLRAHFLDERDGVEPVVEVKLMVLGNGRVGKTQFCRRLAELAVSARQRFHPWRRDRPRAAAGRARRETRSHCKCGISAARTSITARMLSSCATTPYSP